MISGAISALLIFLLPLFGVHLTAMQTAAMVATVVVVVKGIAFLIAGVIAYKALKKKEADPSSTTQPPSS
jgi:positive regulator of sigma E activity